MFRRSTSRYGITPAPVTLYQKAAQIWDERIGSARLQARNWRLMAFGSLFLSAGLGSGLVWQSARGTIVPWVVQVDRLGQAQVVVPATAGYTPTDPQIAWYLAQFIGDVRGLSSDAVVVRHNWLRAYDFTAISGAQALNDYARLNDPFSRIGREQVEVDIASVIRASPGSFRVAWTERHYRDGAFTGTERWTAIVSVVLRTPRDADHLRKNPLGIYVSAINWSKELGQ
ncbi:conjugal transfer protein TrbF [Acetobacter pasteurianus]|nr:conjugal transfer protein TrbF [Acetobacter pasteurianus]GCD66751.1 conjugal transfer protein TrbF [Acetobacter pasteurianus NBRC 3279]GCD73082.1 conjugal transfer protein TrbF [Acetobacter pasteurianus NBRC 3284]